jgi:flagellar biosynthetic protein FliP
VLALVVLLAGRASAQSTPAPAANAPLDLTNPISVLSAAAAALPGQNQFPGQNPALVPGLTLPMGDPTRPAVVMPGSGAGVGAPSERSTPRDEQAAPRGMSASISIILLLTVLTIAPSILILCTGFTRIVIVLALLRQALGTQTLPPSQVIIGLSLLLTLLVMAPTFDRINTDAVVPLQNGKLDQVQAWEAAKAPLRDFMFAQIERAGNQQDVYMLLNYRGVDTSDPSKIQRKDVDMIVLIPGFVLSELKVSFLMGFRLYLPFLIIDMVISNVLISMGMLMLPPVLISLPFKLLMFVLVDGWRLVVGNLL